MPAPRLTKAGDGVLTLMVSNSYTGGTLVSAGTLDVQHDGGLGAGDVTVSDATLTLGGAVNAYSVLRPQPAPQWRFPAGEPLFLAPTPSPRPLLDGGVSCQPAGVYGPPGSRRNL